MSSFSTLRDRLLIFDPGYLNLRSAVRGTFAVVISYFVWAGISRHFSASTSLPFLAVLMALLSAIVVVDSTIKDQKITHLSLVIPTSLAATVSVLLADHAYARLVMFLVFTFIGVSIRRYGPRYSSMGTITFMAYFATLFFPFHQDDLGFMIPAIFTSLLLAYIARFWLLPDKPRLLLALYARAFDLRVDEILQKLAFALKASAHEGRIERNAEPSKPWKDVRSAFIQTNELSLAIEQFFDANSNTSIRSKSDGFRLKAFEQEVALRRLWDFSFEFLHLDTTTPPLHIEASAAVEALRSRNIDLQPYIQKISQHSESENVASFLIAVKDTYKTLIAQEFKEEDLNTAVEQIQTASQPAASKAAENPHSILSRLDNLHTNTRQAIQATIATALASLIGSTISPHRWYWASIAAFTVFIGATRGETMMRAVLRIAGTVLGLVLGFALAFACSGKHGLEWSLIVLCVFFGIFGARLTFGFWTASLFSSMFALLYDILGLLTKDILYLRVEETLVGAVIGVVVAAIVLPTSTHTVVRSALHQYLLTLKNLIAGLPEDLSTSLFSKRKLIRNLRNMDKDLLAVRVAAMPILGKGSLMKQNALPGALHDATMLAHYLRHLAINVDPRSEMEPEIFAATCLHLSERFGEVAEAIKEGKNVDKVLLPWSGIPSRNMSGPKHSMERIRIALASLASRVL